MKITFVIPVYNERDTLEALTAGIVEHAAPHDYQILFVDDGSTDGSYDVMCRLREANPAVKVVRLRGNFGKSAALAAGFAAAGGELVFTMDSDLQDEPKEIPRFIEKLDEGYDVVCGWKAVRHDPAHKTVPSRIYNWFVAWLFSVPLHDVNCGFKLMRAEVVKKIQVYGEMHRLIPVLAQNLNYRVTEIPVEHHRRRYGKSKFGIERFTRGAMDVLTMWFLTHYRHAPGHFFGMLGFSQKAIGFLLFATGIVVWSGSHASVGVALFAAGLLLAATGALTICIGLFAELVLRHFVRIDPAVYVAEENGRDARPR
ncbi:MAG: glycosyltransferase family 2 protein [Candidatus Hydrogenedentes bacterium]|nr:glycosyltransferase family 2 protein [Candidatus Hydrogenedentota bacterium]